MLSARLLPLPPAGGRSERGSAKRLWDVVRRRKWRGKGVYNMEQFDPDPFMDIIGPRGLPWKVITPDDALE